MLRTITAIFYSSLNIITVNFYLYLHVIKVFTHFFRTKLNCYFRKSSELKIGLTYIIYNIQPINTKQINNLELH